MSYRPGHRKTVRHYHDPGHVHELTFSCYHRWPLLTNDVWRGMLAESIDRAMAGHRYRLAAFVFMSYAFVHHVATPKQARRRPADRDKSNLGWIVHALPDEVNCFGELFDFVNSWGTDAEVVPGLVGV